jgi:hypothetical protein
MGLWHPRDPPVPKREEPEEKKEGAGGVERAVSAEDAVMLLA